MMERQRVRGLRDWHWYTVMPGVDPGRPGLYEWQIDGVGSYVGQYGCTRRPTTAYARNVAMLIAGAKCQAGTPDGIPRVHRELAAAHLEGRPIELVILENGEPPALNDREQMLIRKWGALNDPPFGGYEQERRPVRTDG